LECDGLSSLCYNITLISSSSSKTVNHHTIASRNKATAGGRTPKFVGAFQ